MYFVLSKFCELSYRMSMYPPFKMLSCNFLKLIFSYSEICFIQNYWERERKSQMSYELAIGYMELHILLYVYKRFPDHVVEYISIYVSIKEKKRKKLKTKITINNKSRGYSFTVPSHSNQTETLARVTTSLHPVGFLSL